MAPEAVAEFIGWKAYARKIRKQIECVLQAGKIRFSLIGAEYRFAIFRI